ncbi:MAG: hypothetical protein RL385_1551 [Pseudomonadota bacterium]|jgi:hypothetical protein
MTRTRLNVFRQATRLFVGLALASSGVCATADAQTWLPDRQYKEGAGLRIGELEIHPGIALRGGYDNNVFRADGKTRDGVTREKQGSAILAVTGHIQVSTESEQRAKEGEDRVSSTPTLRPVVFRGGFSATYFKYFMDYGPSNVDLDTDLFLGIAPGRPVSLELSGGYVRSVRPFTQSLGKTEATSKAYVFDTIDPTIRVKFGSRSQVLTGQVGYTPRYTLFESKVFDFLSNFQHEITAGAGWKFLPSTAVVYDSQLSLQNYGRDANADVTPLLYSNNRAFKSRLGLNGALTTNVSFRAMAGYALAAIKRPEFDDREDVIGDLALGYRFGAHETEFGYQRDVQASSIGGWFETDRGYARLGMLFLRKIAVRLQGGVGHVKYGKMLRVVTSDTDAAGTAGTIAGLSADGSTKRSDVRADAAIRLEYRATNYLAFMADASWQATITNFEYASFGALPPDPAAFSVLQVFGGVRAHY